MKTVLAILCWLILPLILVGAMTLLVSLGLHYASSGAPWLLLGVMVLFPFIALFGAYLTWAKKAD